MVAAAIAGSLATDALSSELIGLLKVLRDNGTITEAQYRRLHAEAVSGSQAGKPPAATEDPPQAVAQESTEKPRKSGVKAKFEQTGGLTWKDRDRPFELTLGGAVLLDAATYREDKEPLGSGTELRVARLSVKGLVAKDWKYKLQFDFAENELSVKDAYLKYGGLDALDGITVGQFKEPFSLEEQTSGKQVTFMERAMAVDAFSPGRAIGVGIGNHGKFWSLNGGLFADSVGDTPDDEGNEGWGVAGRGTLALLRREDRVLHFGLAGEYREPDSEAEVRYRGGPESHLTEVNLVNTGRIDDVEYTRTLGLEAALVQGPFSLQGEYIQVHVPRGKGASTLDFDGGYLYGSWMITGESRPYGVADGSFERLIPSGKWGAWELGVRFSNLDLNDQDIQGGKADALTLGLNWYVNPRIRFMANYIRNESERRGESDNPDIFQLRSQLVF